MFFLKKKKYISFVMAIIGGGVAFLIIFTCIVIILALCPPLRRFCWVFLLLVIGNYIGISGGYSEQARNMINFILVSVCCIIAYISHRKKKQKERVERENIELLNQFLKEKKENQSKDK